ncbi:hypothetical protein AQJ46_42600 [Streptomyces canus]|uniref:Uncharacterized protein n=1 Tax=Streptomyces canus TaxID=58343 RepID=A0A101RNZ4_9ACTN|nr:hypothetical protein [Streptomyces canus]KUN58960.1 hypothetical protein AQJ46_42600 [Streptomyces canus]
MPTSWPARASARTSSAWAATFWPTTKKVARARYCARYVSRVAVSGTAGPSSKVRATQWTLAQSVSSSSEAVCVGTAGVGVALAPRSSARDGCSVCCWVRLPKPDSQGVTVALEKATT